MKFSLKFPFTRNRSGFTLVELLTVVGIIGILITLCTGSLSSLGSAQLSTGGNMIVEITDLARQNSMSKRVLTALVMAKIVTESNSNDDPSYRAFVLVEKAPEETQWKPLTGWKLLPAGIAVDPDKSALFISQTPTFLPTPNLPPLRGASLDVASCAYQVFLPDGRLSVNGVTSTPKLPSLYLHEKQKGSNSKNYYKVTLNLLTGTARIDRP
jgi:prepilin-type N-terminal cleavage/methylation domain-containing protein